MSKPIRRGMRRLCEKCRAIARVESWKMPLVGALACYVCGLPIDEPDDVFDDDPVAHRACWMEEGA